MVPTFHHRGCFEGKSSLMYLQGGEGAKVPVWNECVGGVGAECVDKKNDDSRLK